MKCRTVGSFVWLATPLFLLFASLRYFRFSPRQSPHFDLLLAFVFRIERQEDDGFLQLEEGSQPRQKIRGVLPFAIGAFFRLGRFLENSFRLHFALREQGAQLLKT